MRGTWEHGRPARQARWAAKMAALPGLGIRSSPLILALGNKGGARKINIAEHDRAACPVGTSNRQADTNSPLGENSGGGFKW